MLLHDYLRNSIARYPDKEAIVCGGARMTYAELGRAVTAFRSYLLSKGLEKGQRVAIFLDNSVETVVSIFGTLEAGGCCVVLNPAIPKERLGFILSNCTPRFLVCTAEAVGQLETVEQTLGLASGKVWTGKNGGSESGDSFETIIQEERSIAPPWLIDQDLAAIIYTSGSTGKPKGVTHLHRSIDVAVDSIAEYLRNSPEDVILNVLPLSSSYGLLQVLVTFKTGGRLVLEKGLGYPFEIVKRIQEEKITGMAGAPTIWAILLRLEVTDTSIFDSLRYITNAAAAMPVSFIPRLRSMFPRTEIFLMHGMTECLRTTYLPPDEVETRTTSVGRGMRNVELWIADAEGRRLGEGQVGEMMIRGSNLMVGYWNSPEETAKSLIPGPNPWEKVLRSGDLFTMDHDGYFHFVARSDELIKSRGEKVSPIEVEDIIYTLNAVAEVRVIGVPDPILGSAIKAEIVLKETMTLTPQEVKAHCKRFLEDFKVPQTIVFVDSLPKTQGGKIRRTT
jgi:long-chain acyl-CoA synthetase